jgi:diguanylate cyclase (GGDEF)-like protein/PAS domain S-box-containing protein
MLRGRRARKSTLVLQLVCGFLLTVLAQGAAADNFVRIGVLAKRGAAATLARWQATADYLTTRIPNERFEIVPLPFDRVIDAVRNRDIDFVLANPSFYVELEARYGVTRIATLRNRSGDRGYARFGGVIFTRADRDDINTITDLRRKRFAAVEFESLGGFRIAWGEMLDAGVDPYADLAGLHFAGTHDAVVYAVRDGSADAGTVRTDTLERMAAEGKIDLSDFRVIHPHESDVDVFPFRRSSSLYPEWPLAKVPHTSERLTRRVTVALLNMPADSRAAVQGKVAGWTVPANYQPVHELLKKLHLGPYRELGKVTALEVVKWYWPWFVAGTVLLLAMAAAISYVTRLNRLLKQSQAALRRSYAELDMRVRERTRELEHANRELAAEVEVRKRTERDLDLTARVFENTTEGILITDEKNRIITVNDAFTRVTGYTLDEVKGRSPDILQSGKHDAAFYEAMWQTLCSDSQWRGEIWNRRKNGEIYPEWLSINAVSGADGRISNYIAVFSDITAMKRSEEQLEYVAHHDPLTGLPNRLLLHDRLAHALTGARRHGRKLAIVLLDLDMFKIINDGLGHEVGDDLLQKVGERLAHCIREEDTLARLGGDEFAVLLEEVADGDSAAIVAEHIRQALSKPFLLEQQEIFVTASMGISVFPADGDSPRTLLKNADTAMYRAKERGRNAYEFYSREFTRSAVRHLSLENGLRRALRRQEFVLYYQPQYAADSGDIVGLEALLRWWHPHKGMVSPGEFIPVAEESGLIVPIGEWVLNEALRQYRNWRQEGLEPGRVAVNISGRQMEQRNILETLAGALKETGVPPKCLELELTESIIMRRIGETVTLLHRMKAMGVQIAIDDFGTGYSSLNYLKRFPIDRLKIDQSFVRDLPDDADDSAICSAVIALARSLNLQVTAEGVETEAQMEFLREKGCDELQGYLFSQPLPARRVEEILRESTVNPAWSEAH